MELISATLNTRPFKRIVRESNTFTLSPKALLFPIMSFQEVRNWLVHVGDQLNTSESWDGHDKLRSRNQSFLQHSLKDFLYNESSWRFGKRKGGKSVVKGEEIKPAENNIVAIKLSKAHTGSGLSLLWPWPYHCSEGHTAREKYNGWSPQLDLWALIKRSCSNKKRMMLLPLKIFLNLITINTLIFNLLLRRWLMVVTMLVILFKISLQDSMFFP